MKISKRKFFLVLIPVALTAFVGFGIGSRLQRNSKIASQKQVLGSLPIVDMEGVNFSIEKQAGGKPTVVVYFNSECDDCWEELTQISDQRDQFAGINLLFISTEPIPAIKAFAISTGLYEHPQVFFARMEASDMLERLGDFGVPHIFIYDSTLALQKEYKGQTKIESLLKYSGTQVGQ